MDAGRLAARGYRSSVLGLDWEPTINVLAENAGSPAKMAFKTMSDVCLKMRMIKSPQEIELLQKAVALQDHLLEYGRALILNYGCGVTDFDIQHEIERYGTHLLMSWMELDGKPHNGVGIDFWITCRAGASTAYPHPNQFYYHKISKGDSIQLAGICSPGRLCW